MPEAGNNSAIKLFGKNIPVPEHAFPAESLHLLPSYNHNNHATKAAVDESGEAAKNTVQKSSGQDAPNSKSKVMKCQDPVQNGKVQEKRKPEDEDVGAVEIETSNEQKALKKPGKVLPCPRCDSMETKFCYFNNYNVNQPRHFCRNCQRYWTAGGTVRNVPVGSGRRKNKQASLQYHQIVYSPAAVPVAQTKVLKSASQGHLSGVKATISPGPIKGLGVVPKFATDSTLCQSMGRHIELSSGSKDCKDEMPSSCQSSSKSADLQDNGLLTKEMNRYDERGRSYGSPPALLLQLYSGRPWLYPWHPGWSTTTGPSEANNSAPVYTSCPPLMFSGFSSPNIAVPVGNSNWIPRMQFFPSTSSASPSSSTTSSGCYGVSTPTLGKHSRDKNLQAEEKTEHSLRVPKTLRINDSKVAAKTPMWNTFSIFPKVSTAKAKMLKALQSSRSDSASHTSNSDQVLQANPAALSRSQSFRENT